MDNDILVVEKPAGMAVQTRNLTQKDLVSEIKNHLCRVNNITNPYLGIIHRLDQPVRGILVFALNEKAASDLSRQISGSGFNKRYLALVEGILSLTGQWELVTDYLIKDKDNIAKIRGKDERDAKKAELKYMTVKTDEETCVTLLDIELITGRFHQIRAQLSNLGHPIVNDTKYGAKKNGSADRERSIALCAYRLSFIHPVTKKEMEYSLDADFSQLIKM